MEDNQVTFAQAVAKLLPTSQQLMVDRWAEVRRAPETEVPKLFTEPDSPELRDLMVYGIKKLIPKQETTAQNLWSEAQSKFPFNGAQSGKVESELGLWDAYRQDTSALMRLRSIPDEYRTQDGNEWMVRIALRQDAWDDVLKAINSMKGDATLDTTWRYWKARALSALGKNEEASTLFNELAQDATFYGFLAADQLGQRYNPLQAAPPDRTQRVNGIKRLAAYERWQEWLALGNREMARKEWFRLVKAMDKVGVQSAAQLANERGDPNLAIWTVSKTKDWNAVDVRFPVYFEDLVTQSSQAQGVLPAWVLGVIRRESAFDQQARSSVNALGLMQLMPATARHVGKRLGLTLNANDDILHPATNVELGSAYLKEMLKRFDGDYARATAAYNAGPGRIPKWKPTRTLQADQWIESIPFEETRNYVQAVMAYTTVYDAKLQRGHALSLSSRLKPIAMD
jgi:soluble lytic murein transglycosylase